VNVAFVSRQLGHANITAASLCRQGLAPQPRAGPRTFHPLPMILAHCPACLSAPAARCGKARTRVAAADAYAASVHDPPFTARERLWLHGRRVAFCYYHAGGSGAVVRPCEGGETRVVPLNRLSRERPAVARRPLTLHVG
jgi:hypothetical protein